MKNQKMNEEFKKFANSQGINSMVLHDYQKMMSSLTPYVIEERQMNVTQMDIFSRLMMDRIIFLGTAIDDSVSNIISGQLLFLESLDSDRDITMYVNSPGGAVYSGLAVYDTMNYIKPDVGTVCIGMAASMGAILLSSGEKGKRNALPNSRVMIHQPLGGARGQASDIEITYKQIQIIKEDLYKILSDNTGKDFDEIEEDADRDFWMKSEEAKEYGIIDEVVKR